MIATLKEIWEYRTMIRSLVHKDLRGRYKASVLGFLWTFILPLCQLLRLRRYRVKNRRCRCRRE